MPPGRRRKARKYTGSTAPGHAGAARSGSIRDGVRDAGAAGAEFDSMKTVKPLPRVVLPKIDRDQLQQLVARLSEGIVLADPDGSIVWANSTALEVHGVETIEGLGRTVAGYRRRFRLAYRNHHALTPAQYPLQRLLAGQSFDDVVVEVRRRRGGDHDFRRVHHLRGLAFADARGRLQWLALVIQDATERFNAEERFERTFAANPAPALICRLSDLRYIMVNDGFAEMSGYDRATVLDSSAYDIDVLEEAESRDEAKLALRDGSTISQREAVLRMADGGAKFVIVAGQPIEVGEEACMLFTFIDLEARKQAEMALRHSEERFSKAFRLAPVPMFVASLDRLQLLDANDAFREATGHGDFAEAPSDSVWLDAATRRMLGAELERHGTLRDFGLSLRTREGTLLQAQLAAAIVTIDERQCVLGVVRDVAERKRSDAQLVAALDAALRDASWFSRTVVEKLAQIRQPSAQRNGAELADLTAREREVLGLICEGRSDPEIATALGVSRNTVRNHVSALYAKLDVHRRGDAIVWGRERGLTGYEKPRPRIRR